MVTSELTAAALQRLVLQGALLVLAEQVLSQQLPRFAGKGTHATLMGQVSSLVKLEALLSFKGLLAGGALYLRVLALLVGPQRDVAAARVVALLAREAHLELVRALAVVSQSDL